VIEAIDLPVHILATSADHLVGVRAIRRVEARLRQLDAQWFGAEAAHEILREVDAIRDRALAGIDVFLERIAPQ
jgi:lysophospholipase